MLRLIPWRGHSCLPRPDSSGRFALPLPRHPAFALACLLALVPAVLPAATPTCTLVPGWTPQGDARSYEAENLFEYMDGNAEG